MKVNNNPTSEFNLVIESFDKENERYITTEDILKVLKPICVEYYLINHYADVNEKGELKRQHYHAVIKLCKRVRKTTIIGVLAELLGIKETLISCEMLFNKRAAVRYLIHLDDPNKYHYDELNIFTNNESELFNILHYDISNLDTEQLIDIVKKCDADKLEIMRVLGLKTYNLYWRLIEIIIRNITIE